MDNTRWKHGMLILVIFILVALAAGPVAAQSYVPTPPPGTIILPPPPGGTVDTPTGTIDVPPNTTYNLVFTPLGSVTCPPPIGCLVFNPFDLAAYDGVDLVSPAYFDPPLEICMNYTSAEVEALGGVENLTIAYWDPDKNQWVPLNNIRIDSSQQQICGKLSVLLDSECGIALTCALSPMGVPVTGRSTSSCASSMESVPAAGRQTTNQSPVSPTWLTVMVGFVITLFLWIRRRQIIE